jgi:hypothetical protein
MRGLPATRNTDIEESGRKQSQLERGFVSNLHLSFSPDDKDWIT